MRHLPEVHLTPVDRGWEKTELQRGLDRSQAKRRSNVETSRRPALSSAVLALLLFCEVGSSILGAEAMFFSALVLAWLVLLVVVGPRFVLDAGCLFVLVSLSIVVAHHGPGSLLA